MTVVSGVSRRTGERLLPFAPGLWGCVAALAVGLAAGHPSPTTQSLAALFAMLGLYAFALTRPFAAFLVLAGSVVMLLVIALPHDRGLNLLDLLLPPLLFAGLFGNVGREVAAGDAAEAGEGHLAIRLAHRRLSRAAAIYFGWAWLSVIPMFFDGRTEVGTVSVLALVRAVEGLLLFPLGLWFMRSERRIRQTIAAMFAATLLLLVVNIPYKLILNVRRAGMTWFFNQPEWAIVDPNEAAAAMLIVVALMMVLHAGRPQWWHWMVASAAIVMLVLTFSRSGLLAFLTFGALILHRARWGKALTVGLLLALALPLVPSEYWDRMRRTLLMQPGTWETYGLMIRFVTWQTAANVFLHHPLFGVGYLGLESVSAGYNELRIRIGAESYILEIAADLGLVGLTGLGFVIARLLQVGRTVRRATTPGSFGHRMAALNTPLVIGLLVASLTGSNFVGMVGLGQLALWSAMLIRAGHEAVKSASGSSARIPDAITG